MLSVILSKSVSYDFFNSNIVLTTIFFSNLLNNNRVNKQRRDDNDYAIAKGFVPTGKKFYDKTVFENSPEFKQLGTLTKENRMADYFVPD